MDSTENVPTQSPRQPTAEVRAWVGLSLIDGIGPARLRRLYEHFGCMSAAWEASTAELLSAGMDSRMAPSIVEQRPRVPVDTTLERADRCGMWILTLADPEYPIRLATIEDAPGVLYVRGTLARADNWCIAVIGTRRMTTYGRDATIRLTTALVRQSGATIVSGLARGVDTCAHHSALEAGGRTLAVLGSGLDVMYPPENAHLAARIVEQGALLSEFPPGTKPDAQNFPRRNRIVAGLARGTLVTEAGVGSGALLTARLALDYNREVFAVPGRISDRASEGTNGLIRESGAKLVSQVEHILEELNLMQVPQQRELFDLIPEDPTEAALVALLSTEPQHVDDLTRQSGLSAAIVGSTLTMLELRGIVRHLGAMSYVLC